MHTLDNIPIEIIYNILSHCYYSAENFVDAPTLRALTLSSTRLAQVVNPILYKRVQLRPGATRTDPATQHAPVVLFLRTLAEGCADLRNSVRQIDCLMSLHGLADDYRITTIGEARYQQHHLNAVWADRSADLNLDRDASRVFEIAGLVPGKPVHSVSSNLWSMDGVIAEQIFGAILCLMPQIRDLALSLPVALDLDELDPCVSTAVQSGSQYLLLSDIITAASRETPSVLAHLQSLALGRFRHVIKQEKEPWTYPYCYQYSFMEKHRPFLGQAATLSLCPALYRCPNLTELKINDMEALRTMNIQKMTRGDFNLPPIFRCSPWARISLPQRQEIYFQPNLVKSLSLVDCGIDMMDLVVMCSYNKSLERLVLRPRVDSDWNDGHDGYLVEEDCDDTHAALYDLAFALRSDTIRSLDFRPILPDRSALEAEFGDNTEPAYKKIRRAYFEETSGLESLPKLTRLEELKTDTQSLFGHVSRAFAGGPARYEVEDDGRVELADVLPQNLRRLHVVEEWNELVEKKGTYDLRVARGLARFAEACAGGARFLGLRTVRWERRLRTCCKKLNEGRQSRLWRRLPALFREHGIDFEMYWT